MQLFEGIIDKDNQSQNPMMKIINGIDPHGNASEKHKSYKGVAFV